MIDAIADISMGIDSFNPQGEAETQFFTHLKDSLAKTQKAYEAKTKAANSRWKNDDADAHSDDDAKDDAMHGDMHMQNNPVSICKTSCNTNNHNHIHNHNQKEKESVSGETSAAVAALTQIEKATGNNPLTTEVQNLKKFIPPTIDEVASYCWGKKYWVDPIAFVNFYESKGWFVGKNKMKSWRAAVVTWLGRQTKEQIDKVYKMYQEKYREGEKTNA
jgi:hypothetical protein